MKIYYLAIILAVFASLCDAVETPLSTLLLSNSDPIMTGSFMFLGAGIGIGIITAFTHKKTLNPQNHLRKTDIPTLLVVTIGDLINVIILMYGLKLSSPSSASLMQSFLIVTTAFIALIFFKEKISKRLWAAILLITLGCMTISVGDSSSFILSPGLILILINCLLAGITTNVRKKITDRNPTEITIIRGLSIGVLGFIIALIFGEHIPETSTILVIMFLGLFVYGISNTCSLISQRHLGTTMSTTILGLYPIIGAVISLFCFHQPPTLSFAISLLLLIPGFYMVVTKDKISEPETAEISENTDAKSNSIRSIRLSNYLVAIGFTIIATIVMMRGINKYQYFNTLDINVLDKLTNVYLICGIFLITIASILIFMRKHNFSAISFLFLGMISIFNILIGDSKLYIVYTIGFEILLAVIFLFSKSSKRFIYSILFFLAGWSNFFLIIEYPHSELIGLVLTFIFASFLLYLAVISLGINEHLPYTSVILRKEAVDFRRCGSMVGYLILAYTIIPWIFVYIFNDAQIIQTMQIDEISFLGALFLALISLLLMISNCSGFTSFIFLSTAFVLALFTQLDGSYIYVIGILLFLIGLYSVMRSKSRLLVALLYIIYGISAFASVSISGEFELPYIQILLNLIPGIIAIYLAFAIFSTRIKFPLF